MQHETKARNHAQVAEALRDFDSLPDIALVRLPTVQSLCGGCSAPTIWRWVRDGRLPKPRRLSPGITGWNVGELRAALRGA
jgi:predicted DNA-binding transcriptional regulator AlpA